MRNLLRLFLAAAAIILARPAHTEDRAPIDLSTLLDELDAANPQLLAMRARAEAAETAAPQWESLPDPKLSATYTNDGLTDFTLGSSEFTNLTVAWEQEVPARAVRGSAATVARADAETIRASAAALRARLRARVITLYAELWRLDRTEAVLRESRVLLVTAAETAQARYESGEGIQEGLIRAQIAVRRVDLELEELRLMRRLAEITLGEALGRTEDPEFGAARELPGVAHPIDAEGLAATAASSSREVLETSSRERAADAALDSARVQVKPTFSWLAAYQFRGGLDPMVMGGFSVRLPVWKDRKQAHGIAQAEVARTAAAHDREGAEVRVRAGVRELAATVATIDVRLRLYREAIVPQSAAALDSARTAFTSGRSEMFLVLDDFDRWLGVRRDELALQARRVQTIASLETMTGTELFEFPTDGRSQ